MRYSSLMNTNKPYAGRMSSERVTEMMAHAGSGAAGVHADQKSRKKNAAGRTNRVGSRSAVKRAVIKDWQ